MDKGSDRASADPARQTGAAIDGRFKLKVAGLAFGIDKIAQAAAPLGNSPLQHIDNGVVQASGSGPGNLPGFDSGPDAGQEQGFTGVNIAHADHNISGQQHLFDRGRTLTQCGVKERRLKIRTQRLDTQASEQLAGLWRLLRRCPDHCTKAPGVMQAQGAPIGHQIHVIVRTGFRLVQCKVETARHAQMQQQQAMIQVEQQIFAAPPNAMNMLAAQGLHINTQGPAQRFAQPQPLDGSPCNAVGKTSARDFNFGQFRHGCDLGWNEMSGRGMGRGRWIIILRMKSWLRLAVLSSCLLAPGVRAEEPAPAPPANSALDAVLFYQLLLGELNVSQGAAGAGFSLILDAARKTHDPALFQRAVDIALQARSGDAALQAAQTWKRELPQAREPNRYLLQILLALNRVDEAGQALAVSIDELPDDEKQGAIASVPRVFARVTDKVQAANAVQKALARSLTRKELQATAWTTVGRMRRDAQQPQLAIEAARQGHASDPQAPGPLILGLSLLPTGSAEIRRMLDTAMQGSVMPELRLGYARSLIAMADLTGALEQLRQLTREQPSFAPGWLLQGMLQVDLGQAAAARQSLERHVALVENSSDAEQQAGLTEALMTLSQLAQQQGDLSLAGRWLNQIPASADPVRLAIRRADLLDQQGRSEEARVVLSQVQPATAEQAKRKTLALSQWLREHRQAQQAGTTIEQALAQNPDDHELLTEQSLVLEKLRRYDEMETVLQRLMRMRPQDPQAYNALGYALADRGVRLEEARALILRAIELAPQDPFIQDSLGWVEFRMGRREEASRILRAAYKARPDAEIAAHLGEVLWSLGQKDEAAKVWREGLLLKADNETLLETIKRLGFKP